jgi:hypothetical protein
MSYGTRARSRYGEWGKHLDLFDIYSDFRDDPAVREAFAEADEGAVREAYGAPEGRVDFPFFLQTVIRHRTRERFRGVASRWDQYLGFENAQDFREHTVSELGAIRGYEGIAEHGEYPRLRSWEQGGPSYAVGKYGGIYGVTYELTINDETDKILNMIPMELGKSMAEYVAKAMVALIESNPTYSPDGKAFFSAERENLVTGSAADVDPDNLMAILDTMSLRRDRDDIPILVEAAKVLVREPSVKAQFDQFIRSTETGVTVDADTTSRTFYPGRYNSLYNVLPPDAVIVEPWLNVPGDYYILASAQDRPAFLAAFLRNRRDPYIFLKDSGMKGLGGGSSDPYSMDYDEIPFKVRHVFGGAVGEPLGAVKAQP